MKLTALCEDEDNLILIKPHTLMTVIDIMATKNGIIKSI